jgi:hypothetical protein
MERITQKQLRSKVEGLQSQGINIAIGWAYGQPRCTTKDEGRDLSPRLPMAQMAIWLDGFACALRETPHA